MFAYREYMSKRMSIARASSAEVSIDLIVSVLACLVIFRLAFSFHIDLDSGTSLAIVSMPIIFGSLPAGQLI
ncbi:sodium-dependent transporter, partial [Marinomonas arenicola]